MDDETLMSLLRDTAEAVSTALAGLEDWGLAGTRPGQYRSDLVADAAALGVLERSGVGVLSEESGLHRAAAVGPGADLVVVVDPVDGSTNASRGLPWYATSLCAVDGDGARAAVVVNLASGDTFDAVRGGGARRNGRVIGPSGAEQVDRSLVALSGYPAEPLGWNQFRALGAAALDLCAVACGMVDGYVDCLADAHGVWDYAGGMLVCLEAGASVIDAHGRDLLVLTHQDRRTPVAAATPGLLAGLLLARAGLDAT